MSKDTKHPSDSIDTSPVDDFPETNTTLGDLEHMLRDQQYFSQSYGRPGIKSFVKSPVVVLCSWAAAVCGFLYGYDQGLINVTLIIDDFLNSFPEVNPEQSPRAAFYKGLVTAIFELGAVVGALQSAIFCDRISRRYTIIVAVFWYLVGSALQAGAVNYTMLVFGRLIGGVGVGGASMIAPLYISEIAPPHIRGALYTLQQWMLILGIVSAYYTTYGARHISGHWSWRTAFVAQMLPGTVLLGIVLVLPFSPRWLGIKGRDQECLETLSKLRCLPESDARIQAEWINIRCDILLQQRLNGRWREHSTGGSSFWQQCKAEGRKWGNCVSSRYIKRIYIGIVLNAFQQWVGVNGFTYYSTTLFAQLGYDYEQRLTLSGLLSIVQLIGSTVPVFIIDRIGRRPLLLFGTFMLMSCHIINSVIVGISYTDWPAHQASAKAGTAFMFLFMFFFETSWGPIAWGLPSEILPSIVRAEGMALSTASNWLSNFVVGLIVPSLVAAAPYGSFALFSCTSLCALIWVFFFVPETKGTSLEGLSLLFKDNVYEEEAAQRNELISELIRTHAPLGQSEK